MDLQKFFVSFSGTALGLFLSRMLPTRLGYPLARRIADFVAGRHDSPLVRAVKANQWVVHDETADHGLLDHLSRETFRSSARSIYEFWHYFRSPRELMEMVEFDPSFEARFREAQKSEKGTLMLSPHICNFDLIGQAVALRGLPLHYLTYPQPPGGYRFQNLIRKDTGVQVTPMSIQALRKASETLRTGGTVVTGVDRPLPAGPDAKYRPRFFGRPAAVPVFYIRLAIKHNLPVIVVGGCRRPDGSYKVYASDPIPIERKTDLETEIIENSETVLSEVAGIIRKVPEQWAMFYPVWPETLARVAA